jgi:hypothetical protein
MGRWETRGHELSNHLMFEDLRPDAQRLQVRLFAKARAPRVLPVPLAAAIKQKCRINESMSQRPGNQAGMKSLGVPPRPHTFQPHQQCSQNRLSTPSLSLRRPCLPRPPRPRGGCAFACRVRVRRESPSPFPGSPSKRKKSGNAVCVNKKETKREVKGVQERSGAAAQGERTST